RRGRNVMRSGWRWIDCLLGAVCAIAVGVACGGSEAMTPPPTDAGTGNGSGSSRTDGGVTGGGSVDAGATDAGTSDAGTADGGAAKGMGVADGTPADPHPSLAATPVISVAGGPAGTVFVGYQGKDHCEDAWVGDEGTDASKWGDPSVYKSGDADRVTLSGNGISVVHYDIFSGPGMVEKEIKGREKLC